MNHVIRLATVLDSKAILQIYAPFILDTAITFETEAPSADEFAGRVGAISAHNPYIVYQIGGEIVGYAYAAKHRERAAYRYDVEVSIYVLPEYHGTGVAHKLYACLFELLKALGYYKAYAAYVVPNNKSMRFHQKFGFELIGTFHKTGYKHGKWRDVTWLEKTLRDQNETPGPIKSIRDLPDECLSSVFRLS